MTADQVDPKAPFGEMKLDMTVPMGADMSAEDRAQLKARCDVIMANKDRYDPPTNTYCETNKDAMAN